MKTNFDLKNKSVEFFFKKQMCYNNILGKFKI